MANIQFGAFISCFKGIVQRELTRVKSGRFVGGRIVKVPLFRMHIPKTISEREMKMTKSVVNRNRSHAVVSLSLIPHANKESIIFVEQGKVTFTLSLNR
jgi:hypothetical protein